MSLSLLNTQLTVFNCFLLKVGFTVLGSFPANIPKQEIVTVIADVQETLTRTAEATTDQDMGAINDPLGQTHSPTSSNHYYHLKPVLFCEILKSGDGTDVQK